MLLTICSQMTHGTTFKMFATDISTCFIFCLHYFDISVNFQVHIGLYLAPFYVGQVQYKTPLQDNPAALWGLTAAGVVTSILLGTALGVCLPRLCRTRRGKSKEDKPPSPTFRDRLFPRLTRSTPPIYPGAFPF